ncbi:uncharacterized protein TEOVI_000481500 [Trypanosoma equiperdum]|uniref:Uncharacterized protein n=2 Tax=Trypanozoon TaxID=39700 RepID=Q38D03_TRYB2|nr:hypothetical protein, unlikely [Trypanosoma brucei brucei TREU927]EAN77317.1 hypothetical protein, unlikely [Trypanosoma brucei brucei TREU927]SCU65623.1 hypothetical protein, conserved [Trypanosoma equiperdum]
MRPSGTLSFSSNLPYRSLSTPYWHFLALSFLTHFSGAFRRTFFINLLLRTPRSWLREGNTFEPTAATSAEAV